MSQTHSRVRDFLLEIKAKFKKPSPVTAGEGLKERTNNDAEP